MKHKPDFGRNPNTLLPCRTPPFQAETMTMVNHHAMGGLRVRSVTGQVIDRQREIIPNLDAAGEVTTGTPGKIGGGTMP